ncbi:MAG: hypothetical protein WCG23_00870 [bacterium]
MLLWQIRVVKQNLNGNNMENWNNSKYNLKIFDNPKVIIDNDLKIPLEIQNGLNVDEKFLKTLIDELKNLNIEITKLFLDKTMSVFVGYKFSDIYLEQTINNNYGYKIDFDEESRGVMSDEIRRIVLFSKNLKTEHIGAILYHELGHFIDAYKNFGNINDLKDLTYSSTQEFINAYEKDFKKNYEIIKNDKNLSLRHFVQDNKPKQIRQTAITETFAELFRLAFNKVNNSKTVELYFPNSLKVVNEFLNNEIFNKKA